MYLRLSRTCPLRTVIRLSLRERAWMQEMRSYFRWSVCSFCPGQQHSTSTRFCATVSVFSAAVA